MSHAGGSDEPPLQVPNPGQLTFHQQQSILQPPPPRGHNALASCTREAQPRFARTPSRKGEAMKKPSVAIVTTGGTISSKYDTRGGENAPAAGAEELVASVPELGVVRPRCASSSTRTSPATSWRRLRPSGFATACAGFWRMRRPQGLWSPTGRPPWRKRPISWTSPWAARSPS